MVKQFEVGKTYRYTGKIGDPTPFVVIGIDEQDARFIVSGKPLVCTYAEGGSHCPDVGFKGMIHEKDGWAFISLYYLFDEVKETTVAKEKQKEKQKEEKKDMPKFEVGKKYRYTGSPSDIIEFTSIAIDRADAEYIVSGKPLTVERSYRDNRIKFKEFVNTWAFSRKMLEKFEEVKQGIETFEEGKYYVFHGTTRPDSWNPDGYMDAFLDGKPHKCLSARGGTGTLSDGVFAKFEGIDHPFHDSWHYRRILFNLFEEVPAPVVPYAERQAQWVKDNNIVYGSKVRLLRSYEPNEEGYVTEYPYSGKKTKKHPIGQVFRVCYADPDMGIVLAPTDDDFECNNGNYFPYFVLEKVADDTPVYGEPVTPPKTSYLRRQNEWATRNDVKVGTKVRVTRIAEDNEDGWNNGWVGQMNKSVGKIGTVQWGLDTSYGLSIKFDGEDEDAMPCYGYPFFVLEVVKDTPTPTKPTKSTKSIKEFETGKWYVCHITKRPADWNPSGKMDALLDGKPHKCTFGRGCLAEFEGIPQQGGGGWSFYSDLDCFEEVPAPTAEVDWEKKYAELEKQYQKLKDVAVEYMGQLSRETDSYKTILEVL